MARKERLTGTDFLHDTAVAADEWRIGPDLPTEDLCSLEHAPRRNRHAHAFRLRSLEGRQRARRDNLVGVQQRTI